MEKAIRRETAGRPGGYACPVDEQCNPGNNVCQSSAGATTTQLSRAAVLNDTARPTTADTRRREYTYIDGDNGQRNRTITRSQPCGTKVKAPIPAPPPDMYLTQAFLLFSWSLTFSRGSLQNRNGSFIFLIRRKLQHFDESALYIVPHNFR